MHQDNARPHADLATRQKVANLENSVSNWKFCLIQHTLQIKYHQINYLFPALQKNYRNKSGVNKTPLEVFASKSESFYRNGLHKLPSLWEEIMSNDGKYIVY